MIFVEACRKMAHIKAHYGIERELTRYQLRMQKQDRLRKASAFQTQIGEQETELLFKLDQVDQKHFLEQAKAMRQEEVEIQERAPIPLKKFAPGHKSVLSFNDLELKQPVQAMRQKLSGKIENESKPEETETSNNNELLS